MVKAAFSIEQRTVASIRTETAARVAATDCSVLLTGETGVGKDYLARWMHRHSRRAKGPFVPVNCGAMPHGLIDSHLFGHVRGSFTDAHDDHLGLVRSAEGGTLFLDEVGELPRTAQIRLLRLLEEREVQTVGCAKPTRVNVRIIAATRCDLADAVRRGVFREDLFYRLNVIRFHIQPLRNRPDEILALTEEFNDEVAARVGRMPLRFDPSAMRFLRSHHWPGNVRLLRTVVERLHVLCMSEQVAAGDLRECGQLDDPQIADRGVERLQEARLARVREAIDACGGSISRAASALGVHRSTVHRWLAHEFAPA